MENGIIRRIDDLGRIVIPKEIRDKLRIKNNESLEMIVYKDFIKIKKYSIIKNIEIFTKNIVKTIKQFTNNTVLICDNNSIIAVAGEYSSLLNANIGIDLENKIKRREELIEKHLKTLYITNKSFVTCYTVSPIINNGNCLGLILIFGNDIKEDDFKLVKIGSKFINNYLNM